ncbi:glycoside hydrolase family 140 protein [Salinibacter sp. 10B]|uniref:glycoside hydrolase family 140 protein n=1 Tax=Salinibacter sp. 10B TaxID=1923971 RepID=UPI000CF4109B|nr:glycoside hydrolase family 140 protein [Salinibacter sp. 10B]
MLCIFRSDAIAVALVVVVLGLVLPIPPSQAQSDASPPPLGISDDGRRLVQPDGTPFFWLGDTAWELFHRLNREEAKTYLDDRAEKGFTVIQAVVLAEQDGLNTPNPYGETPLHNNDPTQPNEAYFDHVDFVVDQAEQRGLYVGMLPTWGDKFNKKWGVGPEILTPENARAYGEFLGERYRDEPIIWILGGDRNPENEEDVAIIQAMADGIETGDDAPLMTYHPMGGSQSWQWFHAEAWLDIHMFQSGHDFDIANYETTRAGYLRAPPRPVIDGEPRYEDIPAGFDPKKGRIGPFDVRQAAYWSVLSGAFGHTYGNNNIWQMWDEEYEPVLGARFSWHEALDHVGATQMGHVRQLFLSRPFLELVPDQSVLAGPAGTGAAHQRAARGGGGRYLIAYTPYGAPVSVWLGTIAGETAVAHWFNPRTGEAQEIGTFDATDTHTFDPPGDTGRGSDWVLVVDAASADFGSPGQLE